MAGAGIGAVIGGVSGGAAALTTGAIAAGGLSGALSIAATSSVGVFAGAAGGAVGGAMSGALSAYAFGNENKFFKGTGTQMWQAAVGGAILGGVAGGASSAASKFVGKFGGELAKDASPFTKAIGNFLTGNLMQSIVPQLTIGIGSQASPLITTLADAGVKMPRSASGSYKGFNLAGPIGQIFDLADYRSTEIGQDYEVKGGGSVNVDKLSRNSLKVDDVEERFYEQSGITYAF
ncbi:MAG: hypothetical protein JNL74_12070, partial [Fibrobacteres bacterium]|nr:hypothetical protein [Fibrobacterota bacterium]